MGKDVSKQPLVENWEGTGRRHCQKPGVGSQGQPKTFQCLKWHIKCLSGKLPASGVEKRKRNCGGISHKPLLHSSFSVLLPLPFSDPASGSKRRSSGGEWARLANPVHLLSLKSLSAKYLVGKEFTCSSTIKNKAPKRTELAILQAAGS